MREAQAEDKVESSRVSAFPLVAGKALFMARFEIEWHDPHAGKWNLVHVEESDDLLKLSYEWPAFECRWESVVTARGRGLVAFYRGRPVLRVIAVVRGAA